ncbi:MAG TPA: iron-containing alcohol dehydrogenase [Candidatus Limnocylindrales bacterium]|nr:iron-containing alcohol dehydrogenase [Candidatus Limnocylindrales bacterium]
MAALFDTVYGRGLIPELKVSAHRPYLVVTMADLWPRFAAEFDDGLAGPLFVETLERTDLDRIVADLPAVSAVIGLGGGQALDVAKYTAWARRIPLFSVPTVMSVNAAWAHRAAVRVDGVVRYVGWAVPEAVYVDFDVIRSAPADLNRSGVGDILCYHTGHWDWKMARDLGKTEPRWPYDERLVAEAQVALQRVVDHADDIREISDDGIRALAESLRWGGSAFHNAGWNPRHIEGAEHFVFYALEYLTGRHFIHGQIVGLGVLLMSALQDNRADWIKEVIERIGVPYRPEQMGVTWDQVAEALRILPDFVERAGLWYTVASERPITEAYIEQMQAWLSA